MRRLAGHRQPSRRTGSACRAAHKDLPIFPLGLVAFPQVQQGLHIFEARYRVLFNTILAGAQGLEEDLIQHDSEFKGTREFGLCWANKKGLAQTGTTLRIRQHARLPDGRMHIDSVGVERFKICSVRREKPVLVCEVEVISDEEDADSTTLDALGDSVRNYFRDFLLLNERLQMAKKRAQAAAEGREVDAQLVAPMLPVQELERRGPRELSFWISSLFFDSALHQQALLETPSTIGRLSELERILNTAVSQLRARVALESAFSTPSEPPLQVDAEAAVQGDLAAGPMESTAAPLEKPEAGTLPADLDLPGVDGEADPKQSDKPPEGPAP